MKTMPIPPALKRPSGLAGVANKIPNPPTRNDAVVPLDDGQPGHLDQVRTIINIDISLIDRSPYQPRLLFDEDELIQLSQSISIEGQGTPIIVRSKANGRFELVAGERRLRAHGLIKKQTIEADVRELTDVGAAIMALFDNDARENLTDFERGRACKKLLDEKKVESQMHLAAISGRSSSTITRCLAYFKLPEQVINLLEVNPNLLGTKVVADFARIAEAHPDVVIKHVLAVDEGLYSQEIALTHAKREVNKLDGKVTEKGASRDLVSSGRPVASIRYSGKSGIVMHCEKDVDPSLLVAKIEELLASDPMIFTVKK